MKKWIVLLLVFVVALSSCAQGPVRQETYGGVPCPIEEINWGMSEAECLSALGISADGVERQEMSGETARGPFQEVNLALPDTIKILGLTATVTLSFFEQYQNLQVGLIGITLNFGTDVDETAFQKSVEEKLCPDLELQNFTWKSEKTLADIPHEIVEEYFMRNSGNDAERSRPLGTISMEPKSVRGQTLLNIQNAPAVIMAKAQEKQNTDASK